MSVTTLDPTVALVVIDLQQGIVASPAAHPVAGLIANARTLADAFHRHRLPVVLVTVAGGAPGRTEQAPNRGGFPANWADLVPELAPQPGDHTVTKRTWGGFTGTGLEAHLRAQEVTQVVIAGIATSIGVESTARQAHELGFNVTLAIDAMTDRSADAHLNSLTRIFPRLGETGTTPEIVAHLEQAHA